MLRKPVSSESIARVGYTAATRTLEIEFHSGRVYQYVGVPLAVYEDLIHSESVGRYFNSNVRPIYSFRLVS